MSNVLNASAALGTESFIAALGLAGADKPSSQLVTLPLTPPGRAAHYAKPTGTIFTKEEILGGVGSFDSTSPGVTTWILPTLAQLGWTWTYGVSLVIPVMRQGLGQLFVNPAAYRGTVASQSAMLALTGLAKGDYVIRSDQDTSATPPGRVYYLSGSTADTNGQLASTLANWTAVPTGAANMPTAAGIVIEDPFGFAPNLLPQWAGSLLELVGPDHWVYR